MIPEIYLGKLLSNLISLTPYGFQELKSFWGFGDELELLRRSLFAIADLVEKLEAKEKRSDEIRLWLRQLKEVAFEADDLLSQLAYETARLQIQSLEAQNFYLNLKAKTEKAGFRLKMGHKLNNVTKSLQNILREAYFFPVEHKFLLNPIRNWESTDSHRPVVGREADVAKIVDLLISLRYQQLTIVPILGMAGIGKTILAKLVSQQVRERKLFDVNMWANVTESFNEKRVFGEMSIGMVERLNDMNQIRQQLGKKLNGKRFLLVLDDVWDDVSVWWDHFKTWLLEVCTNSGNAIIVTTRSNQVASIVEASTQHWYPLDLLSDNECWSILKNMTYRTVQTSPTSKLEKIGMEVAKKCRGLPLVAIVFGGSLFDSNGESLWFEIRKNNVFNLATYVNTVVFSFKLSFDHLPSYLKPCFVFCSIFPKDFPIMKEELIQLWMAEGFVESCNVGNKYFNVLLASSLFQEVERDDVGDVIQCKMHDCVHDLALFLSEYDVLTKENSSIDCTSRIRHLYANAKFANTSMHIPKARTNKLRTIILDDAPYQESWKLKSLRTLHMNGDDMEVLPSMEKMKHLRYLNISNSKIKELSGSIMKLYNLQTLKLTNSDIKELPESIGKLHNLQTLNVSNSNITELPESIGQLHNLQTLIVSNCDITEFPKSIVQLHNLQTLNASNSNIKVLPESIGNLYNLQTLNVSNSDIKELPESILKLNNLQTLIFLECKELTKLPREKIRNLINLKHIVFSYELQMPFGLGKLNGLETLLFFVVGPNCGGSIEELECLNKLRGDLKITRLEEVGDKKEAERANLPGKPKLQSLDLQWSYGENNRCSRDAELLEGLRPHQNIRRIKVKNYMGEKWPSWMLIMKSQSDIDSSFTVLHNLVDLTLTDCWKCVHLPCLGELPYLKFLKINRMGSVKCINYEFYGIDSKCSSSALFLRLFPALKSLSLSWMENLSEWSSPSDGNRVIVFPVLESLSIQSCAKLTGFPVRDLSVLTNLEINDCEEFRFIFEQQSFPFLTSLSIAGCSKLNFLRNRLPPSTSFKDLSIRRCEWLIFIPEDLGKLSSLTSLEIYCCKRLRCLSEEILCKLTQLKNLRIGAFAKELDDFHYLNRIKDLTCLEELEIWGSDFFGREMTSLPNQLQHLTVLKSLKIMGFTTMEALPEWLTNLQSLQSFSLDYCRHLGCPSTTTVLRNLCRLMHLNINCCPILEESKSEWLQSLDTTRIKVEFSHLSKVRVRLGY